MRWVVFTVVLILMLAGVALGAWLGGKSKKVATITISSCLVLLLGRVAVSHAPLWEFTVFPYGWYAIWRVWWVLPFAMVILGAGTRQMTTANARKLVGVLAGTVFVVCFTRLIATALFDPETTTGVVSSTGVCAQTTGYTCGASAAATLLHHYGIESTEREMSELCFTNSMNGTDVFCVARGLRIKLEGTGREVQLAQGVTFEQLKARTAPSMATIKYSAMVDHWVVVLQVREDDKVLVGDPLSGLQLYSKRHFLEKWRNLIVTADPATG